MKLRALIYTSAFPVRKHPHDSSEERSQSHGSTWIVILVPGYCCLISHVTIICYPMWFINRHDGSTFKWNSTKRNDPALRVRNRWNPRIVGTNAIICFWIWFSLLAEGSYPINLLSIQLSDEMLLCRSIRQLRLQLMDRSIVDLIQELIDLRSKWQLGWA